VNASTVDLWQAFAAMWLARAERLGAQAIVSMPLAASWYAELLLKFCICGVVHAPSHASSFQSKMSMLERAFRGCCS
jgi:hypothetical protein